MRAILVHHSFSALGGAELVAIATMEALREMGFKIDLVTITRPQAAAVKKVFNVDLEVEAIKSMLPPNANYKRSLYSQLLLQLLTIPLALSIKADVIINTQADLPLPYLRRKTPAISYVHFPYMPKLQSMNDYPSRYQRSSLRKLYYASYNVISSLVGALSILTLKRSIVITNSEFSKKTIECIVPESHPIIVRPPVDTTLFADALGSSYRENKVLVLGRIAPEKQLETAIEVCRLLDADIKMSIIGSFEKSSRAIDYLKKMENMIKQYGLKDRVKILMNLDKDELKKQMMTAKVYLHTKYDEHFGISIVEAISAGLIPIVPAHGGPMEYIPEQYHYHTPMKAAELIEKYMDVQQSDRTVISQIANKFSKENFKLEIKKIINRTLDQSI